MRARGYIPNQIHIFLRPPRSANRREGGPQYLVEPAFPVSGRSIRLKHKVAAQAQLWASFRGYGIPAPKEPVTPIVFDNTPRTGYRVMGVESRGEGGCAWKVLSPDGHLFDLRDDVFLPILFRDGLPADGLLSVELQWCQNGSQLRLEEVGSKQHSGYGPEPVDDPED